MPVRTYVYDGDAVLQEADGGGTTQATYTRTGGGYGNLLSQHDGSASRYYEPDALGSTDALADDSQAVTDRWAYRAYGAATQTAGSDPTPFTWVGRQGYVSDPQTGLYLLGSGTRYYDPATAQFLSTDPIGFMAGDANLYRYVGNNPVNHIDPLGLYQLTWQTEAKPRYGDCGNEESPWRITWLLVESKGKSRGGYIIQYMKITMKIEDCCGNRIKPEDFLKSNIKRDLSAAFKGGDSVEYWESWPMGHDEVTVLDHDKWDDQWAPGTRGKEDVRVKITYNGTAAYYPTFELDSTWKKPNNEALAGGLAATIVPPKFPADASNEIKRTMTVSWDCCDKSTSTKTEVDWSPKEAD